MNIQQILSNAISLSLKDYGAKTYKEELEQGFKEPCFFIALTSASKTHLTEKWFKHIYHFDVQYFESDKSKAYEMADNLFYQLEVIKLGDDAFRGYDINYDYVDGVLHFMVTYQTSVRDIVDQTKMEKIKIEGGIKS